MRKEVDAHSPKWEGVYEGSGVCRPDLGTLDLRWIAGAYTQRETVSWNGVTSTGTLRKLSRWPAACSVGEGLLQKQMSGVMPVISRRKHWDVDDGVANRG